MPAPVGKAERARWRLLVRATCRTGNPKVIADVLASMPSFPYAFPRVVELAARTGCTEAQVRRALRELEKRGLLLRIAHFGPWGEQRSNDYAALDGRGWFVGGDPRDHDRASALLSLLAAATGACWTPPQLLALVQNAMGAALVSEVRETHAQNGSPPLSESTSPPCRKQHPYEHGRGIDGDQQQPRPPSELTEPPVESTPVESATTPTPVSVSELSQRRLFAAVGDELAARILAVLAHVDGELAEHAIAALLRKRSGEPIREPVGFVVRVVQSEREQRANRPTAPATCTAPEQPATVVRTPAPKRPPDALVARVEHLRTRLYTCARTNPKHAELQDELRDAELALEQWQQCEPATAAPPRTAFATLVPAPLEDADELNSRAELEEATRAIPELAATFEAAHADAAARRAQDDVRAYKPPPNPLAERLRALRARLALTPADHLSRAQYERAVEAAEYELACERARYDEPPAASLREQLAELF